MRWEINIINLIDSFRAPVWYGRWCRLFPKAPFKDGKINFLVTFCVQLHRKLLDPRRLSHSKTFSCKIDPAKKEGILVFLQDPLTCQENTCMKINFNFLHFTSLLTPLFLRIYFLRNISTTEQSLRISHGKVPVTNDTKGHIKL